MKKFYLWLALLSVSTLVYAQGYSSDTVLMEDYTVTASKIKESVNDVAPKVIIINQDDIEKLDSKTADLVVARYLPAHFHKYNGGLAQVSSRGLLSNGDNYQGKVLILVNGHRAGTGNLARIPASLIKKIEIVKGPGSVMYGSSAIGATINIITATQKDKLEKSISLSAGSFNYQKLDLCFEEDFNDFKVGVNAGIEETDDYTTKDYDTVYNSYDEKVFASLGLEKAVSDQSCFSVNALYVSDEVGSPSWENWLTYSKYDKTVKEYNERDYFLLDVKYDYTFDEANNLSCLLYTVTESSKYYSGYGDIKSSYDKYASNAKGLDLVFVSESLSNQKIIAGLNYELQDRENEALRSNIKSTPYVPDLEYDSLGLYLQDSFYLNDDSLIIQAGLRYDYFNEKTLQPSGADYTENVEKDETFNHVSPKISALYKTDVEGLTLKVQIAEAFRAPKADELSAQYEYMSYGSPMNVLGNPELDPETGFTYEANIDYVNESYRASIGFFKTKLKDRIQTAADFKEYNGKFWQTFENIDEASISGIELDIKYFLYNDDSLSWEIFINSVYNTDYEDDQTGEDLKYISDYEIRTGVSCSYKDWDFMFSTTFSGPQMVDNWDSWPASVEEKDSFNVSDLDVSYSINDIFDLSLAVNNIFDKSYEWVRGYIMPERNIKAKVKINF